MNKNKLPQIITLHPTPSIGNEPLYELRLPPISNPDVQKWEAQWMFHSQDCHNDLIRRPEYFLITNFQGAYELAESYLKTLQCLLKWKYGSISYNVYEQVVEPSHYALLKMVQAFNESGSDIILPNFMLFSILFRLYEEDLSSTWKFSHLQQIEQFTTIYSEFEPEQIKIVLGLMKEIKNIVLKDMKKHFKGSLKVKGHNMQPASLWERYAQMEPA